MRAVSVNKVFCLQTLGIFETLGSKISHGTSKKVADVRTHLREVSKRFYLKKPEKAFSFLQKMHKYSDSNLREVL